MPNVFSVVLVVFLLMIGIALAIVLVAAQLRDLHYRTHTEGDPLSPHFLFEL
jgi:hypothetical protein